MVFNWLRRWASDSREQKNAGPGPSAEETDPSGLDAILFKNLAPLDKIKRGLSRRTVQYILTGGPESVLSELSAGQAAADQLKLKLAGHAGHRHSAVTAIFVAAKSCPGPVVQRIGLLCSAAQRRTTAQTIPWIPTTPPWLECLIWEGSGLHPRIFGWEDSITSHLGAEILEAALVHADESPALLARIVTRAPAVPAYGEGVIRVMRRIPGMADSLARHASEVDAALDDLDAKGLVALLQTLHAVQIDPRPWATSLAHLACSGRKTVAKEVARVMEGHWPSALETLRSLLVDGQPTERAGAAELLARHGQASDHDLLRSRLEVESSGKVKSVITFALDVSASSAPEDAKETGSTAVPTREIVVPPRPALSPPSGPRPEQLEAVEHIMSRFHAQAMRNWEVHQANAKVWGQNPAPRPLSSSEVHQLCTSLSDHERWPKLPKPLMEGRFQVIWWGNIGISELVEACARGGLSVIERCRLAHHIGLFRNRQDDMLYNLPALTGLTAICRRADGMPIDLRDLSEALEWCGIAPDVLAGSFLVDYWGSSLDDWAPEQVWPYFMEHLDPLRESLGMGSEGRSLPSHLFGDTSRRRNGYRVLACFPSPPAEFVHDLWIAALGSAKAERELAQRCLENEPDTTRRAALALGDGKHEVRAVAASWLSRRGAKETAGDLRSALAKEKQPVAKAAMLAALGAFGEPIDSYIDRAALRKEAAKGLQRPLPKGMAWIEHANLPDVRWRDSKEPVDREVVRWWFVSSARLKNPAPDPLLVRYCAMLEPGDAETLGEAVLTAWIAEDTRSPSSVPPNLDQQYRQQAQRYISNWAQYYKGHTVESLYQQFVNGYLRQPLGSAIASKGVLALAAAAGGPQLTAHIERYLKTWYGLRAAQCKALLHVLAWCDDPIATQLLLSVAGRFRTAGIRKEAERLVQELADRQGWTMDELADRTAPSAGFDGEGRQDIEYLKAAPEARDEAPEVSRTVTLRLDDALAVHILVDDDKELKNLPSARADEDEASVAAAKKRLSQVRRSLKQISGQQATRLYEAMCTERRWPLADWRRFVLEHPILGRMARRLVWLVVDGESAIAFRPLEDGSLSDAHDNEVSLPDGAVVGVAHASLLDPKEVDAWGRHLADFEVEPLFEQFRAARFELTPERARDTELKDFEGHMVSAFRLRSRATKLGYVRGEAGDGGWFTSYHKHFPNLGIDVVLQFTGNGLPEEDRQTALEALRFERLNPERAYRSAAAVLRLGQVPAVLLAESWRDLTVIAADGTGYDPDWQRKATA